MPYKDLHDEPFDDSTLAKLEIFEDYAKAWIPTFVMSPFSNTICIFDFFAGTGYDKNEVAGSPIRILDKINDQVGNIFQKEVKVEVFFNEFKKDKFELLESSCNEYLKSHKDLKRAIDLNLYNEDFEALFPKLLPHINSYPSLVYLDQNGIKFLSEKYFLELEKTKQTDFLYFVSASYFWRFGERDEFKMHLDIDMSAAKKDPYKLIHRNIIEQLRLKLPKHSKLKLYPFSILKKQNIHGIIFGASHPRAVDKFLDVAWKRNEINGEANFDLDDDKKKHQLDMFQGKKLTKLEKFEENVKSNVLTGKITNNKEALDYTYSQGHIPKHASTVLKQMKKRGEVKYDKSSPCITYSNVYKNKREVNYKI